MLDKLSINVLYQGIKSNKDRENYLWFWRTLPIEETDQLATNEIFSLFSF